MRPHWGPKLGTFISGVLIVLSFPEWDIWPLIAFALVPWLYTLQSIQLDGPLSRTIKARAIQGVWLSCFMSLGGYYWIMYASHRYGGLPWSVAALVLLAFSLFNQIQFVIFGALSTLLAPFQRKWIIAAIAGACLYAAVDCWSPRLFLDTLGHGLYKSKSFRQWASIGGAPLLTFGIAFSNFLLLQIYLQWKVGGFKFARAAIAAFVVIAGLSWSGGAWMYQSIQTRMQNAPRFAQLASIQGNIGDFQKVAAKAGLGGAAQQVLQTYTELSDRALGMTPTPDALIWPETTYPSTFRKPWARVDAELDRQLELYVNSRGTPLLFGGYDTEAGKDFNSLFSLVPIQSQNAMEVYHKNVLLPFGEYVPGFGDGSIFKKWFPNMGFFGRGPGAQTLEIPLKGRSPLRFSPVICYEALVADYTLIAARQGTDLILNVTNDSWFGPRGEPFLHLALTAFRSIETGVPQLRTTNTGISALILADGEITHATQIGQPEIMNVRVPLTEPARTLFVRIGNWFPGFITIVTLALLGWVRFRKNRATNTAV